MNTTYLFPGQGSQFIGMGEDFYQNSQLAQQMFEEASDVLKIDMKKLLFIENDKLDQTEFSIPNCQLKGLPVSQNDLFVVQPLVEFLQHDRG